MAAAAPNMLIPNRAPSLDRAGVYEAFGGVYPPVGFTQTVEVDVQLLPTGYGAPDFGGAGFPELTGGGTLPELTGGATEELAGGAGAELDGALQTPVVSASIPN
jgi:hypothetical protein